jgi:uncharacterized membrane protein YadS
MNLAEVLKIGRSGFLYTACSITGAVFLGLAIGRWLRLERTSSFLITVGTAICGGSAIAAVGPITNATEEEMAVALGTVFLLNSIALLLFPVRGWAQPLSQTQFGLWSALAIHDTSSVVGTTVKLGRALWIVPASVLTSMLMKSKSRIQWPWLIGLFCLAAMANTYVPFFGFAYPVLSQLRRLGLTVTPFLIGTGLSAATLRQVGVRALWQGVLLWGS